MHRPMNTIRPEALIRTIALVFAIALWMGAAGAEIAPVFVHEVSTPVAHAATSDHGIDMDADAEAAELDLHRPNAAPGIAPYFHRSALNRAATADPVQLEGTCGVRGGRSLARTQARILAGC